MREGILPDFSNLRAPQFDFALKQVVAPHPPRAREDIQEAFVRDQQIDPNLCRPEGYMPEPLECRPVEGDLVVPFEALLDSLRDSVASAWRYREA